MTKTMYTQKSALATAFQPCMTLVCQHGKYCWYIWLFPEKRPNLAKISSNHFCSLHIVALLHHFKEVNIQFSWHVQIPHEKLNQWNLLVQNQWKPNMVKMGGNQLKNENQKHNLTSDIGRTHQKTQFSNWQWDDFRLLSKITTSHGYLHSPNWASSLIHSRRC